MAERPIDWEAIERSPEFQELVKKRRSFVLPATIFFLTYYMAFILLCAFARDTMGESVYQGLTVGYVLALTQFLMVLVLGLMYLKRSANIYDPLAEAAIAEHVDHEARVSSERTTAEREARDSGSAGTGSRSATSTTGGTA
ncbi:MAG: DUF485 domain-containing protein [Solirubrobacterales bacterium]|nr:DUF485 domain-containing protein [Solirubrobacterales bacterium]